MNNRNPSDPDESSQFSPENGGQRSPFSLYRLLRRAVVFVLGISVVIVGIVMIVTPGPAIVVIPAGLAILATEFAWAKWLLHKLKERTDAVINRARRPTEKTSDGTP